MFHDRSPSMLVHKASVILKIVILTIRVPIWLSSHVGKLQQAGGCLAHCFIRCMSVHTVQAGIWGKLSSIVSTGPASHPNIHFSKHEGCATKDWPTNFRKGKTKVNLIIEKFMWHS